MALTSPLSAQIDYTITNISDPLVRINSGQTGPADKDVGIVIERGDDTNVAFIWDETASEFALINTTEDGTTSGDVTISSYAGLHTGTLNTASLELGGVAVTATATELNLLDGATISLSELNTLTGLTASTVELNTLDGITSTVTELNIVDGDTTATATTVVDADRLVLNDDGTMVQVTVDDLNTYLASKVTTLTNKTLTSPTINTGTLTSPVINTGVSGTAVLDDDTFATATATTIATAESIKAYVDAQVTASDLDFAGDTGGAQSVDLDSQSLTVAGGTGIDTVGSAQTVTISIDSTVTTLTGSQTLTNKTLTSPVIDTISNSGTTTVAGTGAVTIPVGTTLQRPGSPTAGMMRFNSDDSRFEGYNGTAWVPIDTLYS